MSPFKKRNYPTRHLQTGMAAIGLAVIMLLGCATLLVGYTISRSSSQTKTVEDQLNAMEWAKQALTAYAIANGRLPCHASKRGGTEDCPNADAKGWLPVASLQAFVPPSGDLGKLDIRYMLYRGSGSDASDPDLGTLSDSFSPPDIAGNLPAPVDYTPVVSTLDMCGKLSGAAFGTPTQIADGPVPTVPARTNRAHIPNPDGSGSILNVAYGLAVAAAQSVSASGVNADITQPMMEAPSRSRDANYSDLVSVQELPSFLKQLGCSGTMASLQALNVAQSYSKDAAGARDGNIQAAKDFEKFTYMIIAGDGLLVAGAIADGFNIVYQVALSEAKEAAIEAGLPFTLPLLPLAALYHAAAGVATSDWVFQGIALAKAGVSLAVDTTYLEYYKDVSKDAETKTFVWKAGMDMTRQADQMGVGMPLIGSEKRTQ